MTTTTAAKPLPLQMLDLITGYWVSRGVHVASRLALADHLAKGPKSARELAAASGSHAATLFGGTMGVRESVGDDGAGVGAAGWGLGTRRPRPRLQ